MHMCTIMDVRFVNKLLVPSFVIIVLSTIFSHELKYVIDLFCFKKKHILIIGILSAPDNFEQRLSIRKTWLQLLSQISGSSYFLIGNEVCDVPPVDRSDPYSCVDEPFVLPKSATPETEFSTMRIQTSEAELNYPNAGFIGFSFYVRSRIIVRKLGVVKELLKVSNSKLQVKLISAFDSQVLASVTFTQEMLNEGGCSVLTKSITPVTLDTGFEAVVRAEFKDKSFSPFPSSDYVIWERDPRVINYIQLWEEDSVVPQPYTRNSHSFVFMNYTLGEIDTLKDLIKNRSSRMRVWHKLNKRLSLKLKNESRVYKDIMFLDVVDVYHNLSLKMIQFYKRIVETEYFHYVLKTDDDSFIDLVRVHNQLMIVNKEIDNEIGKEVKEPRETGIITKLRLSKFWLWSFYREFWKVQHSGKWREDHYRSASYPTFPCGGGYVVNKGIVDYIATNEHNLIAFQGEDVSLGIWLSPLPVTQYKIPNSGFLNSSQTLQRKILCRFRGKAYWEQFRVSQKKQGMMPDTCEWTCDNKRKRGLPLCNKVQLKVQDMYDTWTTFINQGFV